MCDGLPLFFNAAAAADSNVWSSWRCGWHGEKDVRRLQTAARSVKATSLAGRVGRPGR